MRALVEGFVKGSLTASSLLIWATTAQAEEAEGWQSGDVVVKAGVAGVLFDSSANVSLAGTPVPGGDAQLSNSTTATFEVEYFFSPNISTAIDFGFPPPEANITGKGSLAALGKVGETKYGIGGLTLRYHFNGSGQISPFVGAGVGRLFIFDTNDGAVTNLDADSAWAPVIQGGVDFHLNQRLGLFANVAYAPMKTEASGTALGAPMTARVTLNPTVVQGGMSFRF
jgi:outer membrane protein